MPLRGVDEKIKEIAFVSGKVFFSLSKLPKKLPGEGLNFKFCCANTCVSSYWMSVTKSSTNMGLTSAVTTVGKKN